jgi:polyribonucleotide nucleotidyltransferase
LLPKPEGWVEPERKPRGDRPERRGDRPERRGERRPHKE